MNFGPDLVGLQAIIHSPEEISLAVGKGLDASDTARFFAMVYTAPSDAAIAGLEAKYFYRTWRPRTAIPRAAEDANPQTDPVWAGRHYRNSMVEGGALGSEVAKHVTKGYLRPRN